MSKIFPKKPLTDSGAPERAAQCWRFGEAELDEARRELRVAGQAVELEPKPYNVLCYLLRHAGQVVSKDELIETVWAGRIVSESVIANCINKLRLALRDERQDLITTVHGYGYRLDADVVVMADSADEPAPASPAATAIPAAVEPAVAAQPATGGVLPRLRARPAILGVALSVLLLAAYWQTQLRPPPHPSVAVLPFENLSPQGEADAYLAGGVQETILAHLARIRGLKVISRTSVMRYRGSNHNVREIGKELNVAHVLEGSVQRDGSRVRVTAQLIDVASDQHLWAETYDREMKDLLTIQSELAERIAKSVGLQISERERKAIRKNASRDASAYELYLRGRDAEHHDNSSREQLFRAQALLERAVAEDSKFALAWAALSRVHSMLYWFSYDPAVSRREQAKEAADHALELDPDLAEAHFSQGLYRAAGFRDYIGATQAYQRALELQPNSAEVHRYIGSAFRRQGRWEEALASLRRAAELDPGNVSTLEDLAALYHLGLRRYEEAAPVYERVLALVPDDMFRRIAFARFLFDWKGDLEPLKREVARVTAAGLTEPRVLFNCYLLSLWERRYTDALKLLSSTQDEWLLASGGIGRIPKALSQGMVSGLAGDPVAAKSYYLIAHRMLEPEIRSRPNSPLELIAMAQIHAGLGEIEQAQSALRRAEDLVPASFDHISRVEVLMNMAMVSVFIGENEQAITKLEELLNSPYGPSRNSLLAMPHWDGLKANPRFTSLFAKAATNGG